jgi:hypothetical protein
MDSRRSLSGLSARESLVVTSDLRQAIDRGRSGKIFQKQHYHVLTSSE